VDAPGSVFGEEAVLPWGRHKGACGGATRGLQRSGG